MRDINSETVMAKIDKMPSMPGWRGENLSINTAVKKTFRVEMNMSRS